MKSIGSLVREVRSGIIVVLVYLFLIAAILIRLDFQVGIASAVAIPVLVAIVLAMFPFSSLAVMLSPLLIQIVAKLGGPLLPYPQHSESAIGLVYVILFFPALCLFICPIDIETLTED